jgi:hypothetical protein
MINTKHTKENRMENFNSFTQVGRNLYKKDGIYYRLSAIGVTPNGCWLIAPEMIELEDINIATGKDVYGEKKIAFDVAGTVPAGYVYIDKSKLQ